MLARLAAERRGRKRTLAEIRDALLDDDLPSGADAAADAIDLDVEPEPSEEEVAAEARDKIGYPQLGAGAKPVAAHEPLELEPADGGTGARARVPAHINQYLREYQKEGVRFLWRCYSEERGGLLADDMGLGKTVQTLVFLMAVFGKQATRDERRRQPPTAHADAPLALIVCPQAVLTNWKRELETWCDFGVAIAHGSQQTHALQAADERTCEVLICTYALLRDRLSALKRLRPTIAIFDEAHELKNCKSKAHLNASALPTAYRYGLTGTPLSNDMKELHALLHVLSRGRVGSADDFKDRYSKPIKYGSRFGATEFELRKREDRCEELHERLLSRWMLQRKKSIIAEQLPRKTDNIVFCPLESSQASVYARVLESSDFEALRNMSLPCGACGSGVPQRDCCVHVDEPGPLWHAFHPNGEYGECRARHKCPSCLIFPAISKLLHIANHLDLIRAVVGSESFEHDAAFARMAFGCDADGAAGAAGAGAGAGAGVDPPVWQRTDRLTQMVSDVGCGKLTALRLLLTQWRREEAKVLVFSWSVRMMDVLEKFLAHQGHAHLRLDGSTSRAERDKYVREFNSPGSAKFVFLISTRAGGVGLNLVAANKVVVFDPNWNPSHDLQAQDRAFRIGQRRDVDVYRLVAAHTIEEKIYMRQMYKQGIAAVALAGTKSKRYFVGVQGEANLKGELFGIANLLQLPPRPRQSAAPPDDDRLEVASIVKRQNAVKSLGKGVQIVRDELVERARTTDATAGSEPNGPAEPNAADDARPAGAAAAAAAAAAADGEAVHNVDELVSIIESDEAEAQRLRRREQAIPLGDISLWMHEHGSAIAADKAEDELVAKIRSRDKKPASPAAAGPAAPAPKLAAPDAECVACGAQAGGSSAQASAGPVTPAPRPTPLACARRLVEVAHAGASQLGRLEFVELMRSTYEVARAVSDMEDDERDALAQHINANGS